MRNVNYLDTREFAVRDLDKLVVGELFYFIHDGRSGRHHSYKELVEIVRAPYFYRDEKMPDIRGIRFKYVKLGNELTDRILGAGYVWEGYPTDRGVLEYGYEQGVRGFFNEVNWTLSVKELAKAGITLVD